VDAVAANFNTNETNEQNVSAKKAGWRLYRYCSL